MPNTSVPAAGEAMPAANLNRRLALLGGLTAAAALAALPIATASSAVPAMSPIERAKHHLDELRKAMEEHSGEPWWTLFNPKIGIATASQNVRGVS